MPASHSKPKKLKNNTNKAHFTFSKKQVTTTLIITILILNSLLLVAIYKINKLAASQASIMAINEVKTQDGITVNASNVQVESNYIMGIKGDENMHIISAEVTISNNSSQPFDFYPSIQTFVRDNEGSTFLLTPVQLKNPFAATSIASGETKTGQLSYMVTSRSVPLFLYLESRQQSAAPFVIKLQ